jgi:hypothetical protein
MEQVVISLFALAILLLLLVRWKLLRRRLSAADKKRILALWEQVDILSDPLRRVLEADKVLDHALTAHRYKGSLGEKLKKAGPRFSDLNAVWRAHKLRNRIAHEPGIEISKQQSAAAVAALHRAVSDLL